MDDPEPGSVVHTEKPMTEYQDDVTFQILGPAIRLPDGRVIGGQSTEIARVSAGQRLREEQERILAEDRTAAGDEGENAGQPQE